MLFADNTFFNDLKDKKPHIAISACLLGENVRYNGENKYFPHITDFFQQTAILTSLCPETGAGLGVPRPPVQVTETDHSLKVLGVDDNSLDVTQAISDFSASIHKKYQGEFQACILKARSPSCGIHSTPIFSPDNNILRYGKGLFSDILSQHWRECLFIEEEDLQTETQRNNFLLRCYILLDIKLTCGNSLPGLLEHYQPLFGYCDTVDKLIGRVLNTP